MRWQDVNTGIYIRAKIVSKEQFGLFCSHLGLFFSGDLLPACSGLHEAGRSSDGGCLNELMNVSQDSYGLRSLTT